MTNKLIYIASPYSHDDPNVRVKRFMEVFKFTQKLLENGVNAFSPIVYSHQFACMSDKLKGDWQTWKELDELMLSKCDGMVVLCIVGYRNSTGINTEVEFAYKTGVPVTYYDIHSPSSGERLATFLSELNETKQEDEG